VRNIIAVSAIVFVVLVVAGLLRRRARRRSRTSELPPLFFPLAKNNQPRRGDWQPLPPIPPSHARAIAMNEPLPDRAGVANPNISRTAHGIATHSPHPASVAGPSDVGAATSDAASVAASRVKSDVAADATTNASATATPHIVNNAAGNGTANVANNGAPPAHIGNGRGSGISFAPPNGGRPNVPPQINTPTHLKVVRDFPNFPDENEPAPTETVRFRRPTDEAVQLLPGRLQVISGDPRHQEIRFVRIPGRAAELILGREPGDTAQHVALNSSTVSRKHARFAFQEGRWHVVNLSQTNPVVVNGEELSAQDNARPLDDGDQVELGEVVLRFRSH
jgi:pSer/pThr/pTyr-binding forkhead associated (FHA) protein